jgi:RimJ/RimL family protein N-acetyltransferase
MSLLMTEENRVRLEARLSTFSRAELEQWYGSRAEHADRLDLAIVERATGRWAGEVVLNELDPDNESCGSHLMAILRSDWFSSGG